MRKTSRAEIRRCLSVAVSLLAWVSRVLQKLQAIAILKLALSPMPTPMLAIVQHVRIYVTQKLKPLYLRALRRLKGWAEPRQPVTAMVMAWATTAIINLEGHVINDQTRSHQRASSNIPNGNGSFTNNSASPTSPTNSSSDRSLTSLIK